MNDFVGDLQHQDNSAALAGELPRFATGILVRHPEVERAGFEGQGKSVFRRLPAGFAVTRIWTVLENLFRPTASRSVEQDHFAAHLLGALRSSSFKCEREPAGW
ncbi:MAG: hypothetical protein ACRC7O_19260, partial [Fimbriiglobus sp.]